MLRYLFALCIMNGILLVNCMQPPAVEGTDPPAPQGDHSNSKVLKLEEEHFKDYKGNRDAYRMWPELEAVIKHKNRICQNFFLDLGILERVRRITASVYGILVHYPLKNYHVVKVQGLKCHVPPDSTNIKINEFILSRSPRLACFLILVPLKQTNHGWVGENYQIAAEHCDSEYKPRSTPTTNDSTNKRGNSGQDPEVLIIPKVEIKREMNEEVDPRPRLIIPNEKNKQKMKMRVKQEIMDEDELSEMEMRRIRKLAIPKQEQDDWTKEGKKRNRWGKGFSQQ